MGHPTLICRFLYCNKAVLAQNARLGFVFLQVFSCEGGIQSYIKDILKAYLAQPSTPPADVFLLRDGVECENPFEGSKLTFHYFKSTNAAMGRLKLAANLIQHLLKQEYQHVICGHTLLLPLITPLCKTFGIPYSVMTYGKEIWSPMPPRQRQALQQAASIWAISRYSRELACSTNGLDASKFHMLPCVVDGCVFTPGEKNPDLIHQYALEHCRVLMTVARLWSGDIYKGVDITIRALPDILAVFPDVKYLVIGRGDDQPRLAQLAADFGVSDRVIFAGFVPNEALVEHYRLADVYVMPSQEGFGIVYLEAMACGIPTISGDSDGSADPLQDGKTGWHVPYRDPLAVAQACIEVLKGDDPRCNGAWLRQEVLKCFSPQGLEQKIGDVISTL